MADNNVIVGVFYGREQAQAAIRDLQQEGFRDIGYVEREDDEATRALPAFQEKQDESGQTLYLIGGAIVGVLCGIALVVLLHVAFIVLGAIVILGTTILGACTGMLMSLFLTYSPAPMLDESDAATTTTPEMLRTIVIVQSDVRTVEAYSILARHRPLAQNGADTDTIHVVARDRLYDPEATIEMRKQDLNEPQQPA